MAPTSTKLTEIIRMHAHQTLEKKRVKKSAASRGHKVHRGMCLGGHHHHEKEGIMTDKELKAFAKAEQE